MILNFQFEAAKRRDRAGRTGMNVADRRHDMRLTTEDHHLPKVEFGSGWYHSAAVKDAAYIGSHRD